jgi:hypothetical protein
MSNEKPISSNFFLGLSGSFLKQQFLNQQFQSGCRFDRYSFVQLHQVLR